MGGTDVIAAWEQVVPLVRQAGEAILEVYAEAIVVETKADDSPVTAADHAAHAVLVQGLRALFPDVPVLSEEGEAASAEVRQGWKRFFLIDPLDGTKEFIRRNGEFTVNVALIEDHRPVAGVVGVPVQDVVYAGVVGSGATRRVGRAEPTAIGVAGDVARSPAERPLRVVASRSHRDAATEAFLSRLPAHETLSCGSSLKICRIAEGAADLYPRFGPTMEWDTAAAHAVLKAAGGEMVRLPDGAEMRYNKTDLHNPGFVATGSFDVSPYLKDLA